MTPGKLLGFLECDKDGEKRDEGRERRNAFALAELVTRENSERHVIKFFYPVLLVRWLL